MNKTCKHVVKMRESDRAYAIAQLAMNPEIEFSAPCSKCLRLIDLPPRKVRKAIKESYKLKP